MCNPILRFAGPHRFLSNFIGDVTDADGRSWLTVEHAYQAAKTHNKTDKESVSKCRSPAEAKIVGRSVHIREDWDAVKLSIMEDLVRRKFQQSEHYTKLLLITGKSMIIEGNNWGDRYWGVCRGVGENHLGRILMKVREELTEHREHYDV